MAKQFQKVNKGLTLRPQASAPADLEDGDVYYNSTLNKIRQKTNGAETDLGSGGGSGGSGDDILALEYNASLSDDLTDTPGSSNSSIDTGAGKTTGTYVPGTPSYYTLSYDASKTVTGTGVSMTLSGTPAYTVAVGDILRVGTEARRITVVTSQVLYTIESAFTVDPSGAAATVSQAVYTLDLNNTAYDGITAFSQYPAAFSETLLTYNDSVAGTTYNGTDPANVAWIASTNGTAYSSVQAREANLAATANPTGLSSGTNFYIRFFSNKTSGSGTVRAFGYKARWQRDTAVEEGAVQWASYCFTDGTGTEVNCTVSVVNSKTRITFTGGNTYPVAVNPGTSVGSLRVKVNGVSAPRFIDSTLTPDLSYTEPASNAIDLDQDYSGSQFAVEVYLDVTVVDSNTQNTTDIANLKTHQLKNYFINGNMDFAQRGASFSTPSNGSYTLDRYLVAYDGTIGTFTLSQQAFTLGQTDVPNEPSYFMRWNQTAAGSGSTLRYIEQRVESVKTLANKQVTVKFWAKADTARTLSMHVEQKFGSGGSPSSNVVIATQSVNLTTVWQPFTLTFAIPSIAGKTLGTNGNDCLIFIWELPLNTTMTIDIAQAQANEGSVAAPWSYASGGSSLNYEAEFGLCQRFCQTFGKPPDQTNNAIASGFAASATSSIHYMKFHRPMRANPTLTVTPGDWAVQRNGGGTAAATAFAFNNVGVASARVGVNVAAGLTAGEGLVLISGNQNGIILEAEL